MAVDHGRIARGWMMPFNGMVQKGMMEFGRGRACVPARVALPRAHPSLGGAFHGWKHLVCAWKRIIRGWKCNVCGWQYLIFGWKRRYANVRAGTQAPPLPFQHVPPFCKSENKNFNARSNAASDKTQKTVLAVTLQAPKRKKQCSQ